ncbi:hypothetical protein GCM10027275_15950 [Rhabdobacter roseus]|uniref:Gliding motility-associated-like protein n=1 Tax=Rhabdobacter roseus TaxID=1655419 RepID=A0A840TKQ0_9BACT|nr:gliding motility-associated C-terminal domain-containing protein [Rhabdobacter roseus]MBB5283515.1 gliding motility-associated-like protein [Rhabdobacter roseus]
MFDRSWLLFFLLIFQVPFLPSFGQCPPGNDTLALKATLLTCSDGSAKLIFDAQQPTAYDKHWIDWGDGSLVELPSTARFGTHTYQNPVSRTVTFWGMHTAGFCRGAKASLTYQTAKITEKPVLHQFSMESAATAELSFSNPLKLEVELLRLTDGGTFESTGRTSKQETEQIRVLVDSLKSTCFKVQATESCLAPLYQSEVLCSAPLQLTAQPTGNQLSWRIAQLPAGAKVTLEKDRTAWRDVTSLGAQATALDDNLTCGREHCYRIKISTATGTFMSLERCRHTPAELCGVLSPLYIPDAFSPNGDGINDVLQLKGEVGSDFQMTIFDKWGTVVFHTTTLSATWDGTLNNVSLPPGQYPYVIKLQDSRGKVSRRTGAVLLMR